MNRRKFVASAGAAAALSDRAGLQSFAYCYGDIRALLQAAEHAV